MEAIGAKLFILVLDGASYQTIEEWLNDELLPNLTRLLKKGTKAILHSTIPPDTPPAWTTMFTGVNPGKHNIYGFLHGLPKYDKEKKDYIFSIVNSKYKKAESVWKTLSKEGKRVISINVPLTYPPEKIRGIMVSGFMTPSSESEYVYPIELKEPLEKNGYKIGIHYGEDANNEEQLLNLINRRIKSSIWLMNNFNWDLFILGIMETDQIGHLVGNDRKKIFQIYKTIDEQLEELIQNIDSNCYFMILSDHGFKEKDYVVYPNKILYDNGFLKTRENRSIISKLIPHLPFKEKLAKVFRRYQKNMASQLNITSIKYIESIGYNITSSTTHTGIRLNIKGREPTGVIDPKNYIDIRKKIMDVFRNFDNKHIKYVYKREDVYSGKFIENAPDIILESAEGTTFNQELSNKQIKKQKRYTHDINGLFYLAGPPIREHWIEDLDMVDIVPIILHIFNIRPSSGLDGCVPKGLFENNEQ